MAAKQESEHKGHRNRMRDKFIEHGLDIFENHEALEMYLYYAVPRRDTNPLAHRLLDRYVTIGALCDAPIDELENDFGLSKSAAVLLKMLPEMSRLYNESKMSEYNIVEPEIAGELIQNKFIGRTSEVVVLLLVDAKCRVKYFDVVTKGSVNATEMPIRKIVDLAIRHNAKGAYLAHNHPSGSILPSRADIATTKKLFDTLRAIGLSLIDHYIVTDYEYFSLRESAIAEECFGI